MKKMINKLKGFTPAELAIVVCLGAFLAAAFIFMANSPKQMAQLPPINVNVQPPAVTVQQPDVNVNVEAPEISMAQPSVASRYTGTFAVEGGICGDGTVDPEEGEECDDAGESSTCDTDCTVAECGDGTLNVTYGEECDDGENNGTGNGYCLSDCSAFQFCGDGTVNGTEKCDDSGESETCDSDCTDVECGDSNVNVTSGEECDDGNLENDDGCDSVCECETVVTDPDGNIVGDRGYPEDLNNVQCAVNQGGTVNLAGEFSFGDGDLSPRGSVRITNDVEIIGEAYNQVPSTKITDGHRTFFCNTPDVDFAIKNIHFDGSALNSIRVEEGNDITIAGNSFTNPVAAEFVAPPTYFYPYYEHMNSSTPVVLFKPTLERFNLGTVILEDNYMDLGVDEQTENIYAGVYPHNIEVVTLVISGNIIKNYNRQGISIIDVSGVVMVENNDVDSSDFSASLHGNPGNYMGMLVAGNYTVEGAGYDGQFTINNNKVSSGPAFGTGIMIWSNTTNPAQGFSNAVVTNNHVITQSNNAFSSFPLSDSYIGQNKFEGTGFYGVNFWYGGSNLFLGNNFDNFSADVAEVNLGSNNNKLIGGSGTVQLWPWLPNNSIKGDWVTVTGEPAETPEGVGPLFW
jgi:cysteine-rich repeat protein